MKDLSPKIVHKHFRTVVCLRNDGGKIHIVWKLYFHAVFEVSFYV
jgi:hypothetical protein